MKYATQVKSRKEVEADEEKEDDKIREILSTLKEREKRKLTRQLQLGEVDYDQKLGKLVYTESKEEYKYGEVNENEDSQEDDSDEDN